jgi:hypothetical protein
MWRIRRSAIVAVVRRQHKLARAGALALADTAGKQQVLDAVRKIAAA